MRISSKRGLMARITLAFAAVSAPLALGSPHPASAASTHALIQGSGSSWSANAINQWISDEHSSGIQVIFTSTGSAQGRKDYANQTTDYAVSDIGYQGKDPVTGDVDTSQGRSYAYLPMVAGGTAFPYQVRVSGQLKRDIRLSGSTLMKIFTNQITNWNDPAITTDNNGHALPSLPIIPVVHSEGSGSTAQFTRYLAKQFSSDWTKFSGSSSFTEYFPRAGSQIAQNGSDGVMNFISSSAANGAIGYDEYSYAQNKNYPVMRIENTAGYFTSPTQYDVAVALTQAQINTDKSSPDYLLQNLDNVYTYNDPRTYPLSSYSYMLIPTATNDSRMTTAKRQTLADFIDYSVCAGQAEMGPIGYSPLPINLVQASFDQVSKLHDADSGVDISHAKPTACNNPTFDPSNPSKNHLAEIAPQPPACSKSGAGPCENGEDLVNGNPDSSGKPTSTGTSGASGGGASAGSSGATGSSGSSSGGKTGSGSTVTGGTGPGAGQSTVPGAAGATGSGSTVDIASNGFSDSVAAAPVELTPSGGMSSGLLSGLAVLEVLVILVLPPVLASQIKRRRAQ